MNTADAIVRTLESPNVNDSNLEPANVVDVVDRLARATFAVAKAITPRDAAAGRDASGGSVESLTEAVMGITGGLHRIADAIDNLAEAVRERQQGG